MKSTALASALGLVILASCGKEEPHPPPKPDPIEECRKMIIGIMVAVQRYDDQNGSYPASGAEALVHTLGEPGPDGGPYLAFPNGLNDPWGNPWIYVNNVDGTAPEGWGQFEPYAVYSFGPNGKDEKGEGDDIASWKLD